jgi:alpha-mannosidase
VGNPEARGPGSGTPAVAAIRLEPDLAILSACKAADRRDLIAFRLYNPAGQPLRARVSLDAAAWGGPPVSRVFLASLEEEPLLPVTADADGHFAVALRPYQILTLLVARGRHHEGLNKS